MIAIDIGNSTVKFCRYDLSRREDPQLQCSARVSIDQLDSTRWFEDVLRQLNVERKQNDERKWYAASVHTAAENQVACAVGNLVGKSAYRRLTSHDLPVHTAVDQPERVGVDRLLASVAVNHLRDPERPAIIVDAGSAVTVDLVAENGTFQGGAILPGVQLQARALHEATDALPLVSVTTTSQELIGRSTESAIQSGILVGLNGAVREIIERFSETLRTSPKLYITGGDLAIFKLHLGDTQVIPHLVTLGIAFAAK